MHTVANPPDKICNTSAEGFWKICKNLKALFVRGKIKLVNSK
jgi:hypothetical protein